MAKDIVLTFKVSVEENDKINLLAKRLNKTRSELIRFALKMLNNEIV